jgi:hypothetical protein
LSLRSNVRTSCAEFASRLPVGSSARLPLPPPAERRPPPHRPGRALPRRPRGRQYRQVRDYGEREPALRAQLRRRARTSRPGPTATSSSSRSRTARSTKSAAAEPKKLPQSSLRNLEGREKQFLPPFFWRDVVTRGPAPIFTVSLRPCFPCNEYTDSRWSSRLE